MQKIEEEVEKRRTVSDDALSQRDTKVEIRNPEVTRIEGDSPSAKQSDRGVIKRILWKYGTKYAAVIKRIPVVNKFAEKYYWKLARIQKLPSDTYASFHTAGNSGFDIESNLNYIGFLGQIRHEGLKGRIKRLIFNIIGFFAWWQGQVNKALYAKIARHEAQLVQQTAQIASQEAQLLHQTELIKNQEAQVARQAEQINNQQKQLADRDKTFEDLVYKLSVLSRIEDSLYKELTNQKSEIARLRREIAEHTCQQKDS